MLWVRGGKKNVTHLVDKLVGLLTYLHGPVKARWYGGHFSVRMLGLKVPVRPMDVLIFVSRLWHEVDAATGVRCSLVSYIKKFSYTGTGISRIYVPDNIKWVFEEDFGLGFY
jgi:hypothetical protein